MNLFDFLESLNARDGDVFTTTTTSVWTYTKSGSWLFLVEEETRDRLYAGVWASLPSEGWRKA